MFCGAAITHRSDHGHSHEFRHGWERCAVGRGSLEGRRKHVTPPLRPEYGRRRGPGPGGSLLGGLGGGGHGRCGGLCGLKREEKEIGGERYRMGVESDNNRSSSKDSKSSKRGEGSREH